MVTVVEDRNGTKHVVKEEKEKFYDAKCLRKYPEGRYYNGEFKGLDGLKKEDLETQEVEDIEEIKDSLCDSCRMRESDDEELFETNNEVPPTKFPLLENTEDNVDVNRTGKVSHLEKRLIRTAISKFQQLAEEKNMHEKGFGIYVDSGGGSLFVGFRIKHSEAMFDLEEVNKTFDRIQEAHNFPEVIGDISIHPGYEDEEHGMTIGYSFDKSRFETKYYREYGKLPRFEDYDNSGDKGMYAGRVVFG